MQVLDFAALSYAVHFTVVAHKLNWVTPLVALQDVFKMPEASAAVIVKLVVMYGTPFAVDIVCDEGQVTVGFAASVTIALKVHELLSPALLVAAHATYVVPSAKFELEETLQLDTAIPLPSVTAKPYAV